MNASVKPRLLICLTLLASLLNAGPLLGQESRPNVLFLAVDDMNDFVGCLQSRPNAITPNLNRLAARGVCFTNAHTAGVFCVPVVRRSFLANTLRRRDAMSHRTTLCIIRKSKLCK